MFSGIGGFELGITRSIPKSECVGFSEIDKYATQIYLNHFPTHTNYGNATTIVPTDLPDFDLLVGGFPCQAFSIAGKRRGFDDTRGTLFFDIARILKVKKPRNFVLENVKGLLSHDNGNTFKTIIATLIDLGYSVQGQVLNSKNFGVPQNRERVFIIGHLGGFGGQQIFPIREGSGWNIKSQEEPPREGQRLRGDIASVDTRTGSTARGQHLIASTLAQRDYKGGNNLLDDGVKIRRLTPTECERLQGYPDGWITGVSDTQRYKCLGNAVTVNVIECLIKQLTINERSV